MCGLVGVAGQITFAEKDVFSNLLWMDKVRGKHSTGVASINNKQEIKLFKEVGTPDKLYAHKEWFDDQGAVKEFDLRALIGHNRFATVGAKTVENAHPFHHEDIVGAHNGTLTHTYQLPNSNKFQVDSEAIFFNLDLHGVQDTMKHLCGAWALTWYDRESQTMNFLRNDKRPLFFAMEKDESCVFWSSDAEMLELALDYSQVKYQQPEEFIAFKHYTLDLKGGGSIKNKKFEYEEEDIKGFTPPVAKPLNGHGYGNFFQGHAQTNIRPIVIEGNTGTPPDDEDMKKMKAYVGKDIEFFIKGERTDCNKVAYLLAESVASNEYWEIRLYIKNNKRWAELLKDNGGSSYNATVKKISRRWDPVLCKPDVYMLLDNRTISEPTNWEVGSLMTDDQNFLVIGGPIGTNTLPFKWTPEVEYIGWKGTQYTQDEFTQLTWRGCDCCGDDAENLHDPKKLQFISESAFLCPVCLDNNMLSIYQRM